MNTRPTWMNLFRNLLGLLAWIVACGPWVGQATPYASGVTNAAGTVSFVLNEDADQVSIVFNNGASTNSLGALGKGRQSFSMGANTSFRIVVTKDSPPGFSAGNLVKISDDSKLVRFNAPRGLAVNLNPASPFFGRVYVANSVAGSTTADGAVPARTLGDGIYILNADGSDALGQGDTALTGGIAFDTSGTPGNAPAANSPWRIEVGQDDQLYIADFSTVTGSIYRTDPNVSAGSGVNLFEGMGTTDPVAAGHGRFGSSAIALGSLAGGDLTVYALEGDLSSINGLRRYNIGSGPLPMPAAAAGAAPNLADPLIRIVNVTVDMDRAPDGKFFLLQNRSVGTEPGLYVIDSEDRDGDGLHETLFDSLTVTRAMGTASDVDILRISRAVKVSPDGKRAAIIRDDNNIWILGLTNGVPDLTSRLLLTNASNTTLGRDIAFDPAGNIYAASSGQSLVRIFSPGGLSTAVTGSDGTFNIHIQNIDQFVTVAATDDAAAEQGSDGAAFTITRAGPTSAPLTVAFTLSGTATSGLDFADVPLSATIPPGAAEVVIAVKPIDDDVSETAETVVLNLVAATSYGLRIPSSATVTIADNEPPSVEVSATDATIYERMVGDIGVFTVRRLGKIDVDLNIAFAFSGSASLGIDFEDAAKLVAIPAGATNAAVSIRALDDALVEGDETILLTLVEGAGYRLGTERSASVRIQDDDQPPVPAAQILFADNFETDTSAKWVARFGANNLINGAPADFDAWFAYNYGGDGLPPAPHSTGGTTLGLKVQVNKSDPTAAGSAGVNLYPVGLNLNGDFALQFDMYLSFSGASTTEHALAGINHSGSLTNRATQSADAANTTGGGDGLWFAVVTDASNLRDYGVYAVTNTTALPTLLASRAASTLTEVFPSPPFAFAGSPANNASSAHPRTWADVEIRQVGDVVSLKIDQTAILQVTNTTAFKSGTIMLGHNDQYDSVGSIDNFVIFDNVRVVKLETAAPAPPGITGVLFDANGALQIRFTAAAGASTQFGVQSADAIGSPTVWKEESGATVQSLGADAYQATLPRGTGAARFFRIKR